MSSSFFKKPDVSNCGNCPLALEVKKGNLKLNCEKNTFQFKSDVDLTSNLDILFLTDCVEITSEFDKMFKYIKNLGVTNFALTSAIGCRTASYDLPQPYYETYKHCNSFDIKKYNPKIVITMGKAFMHFTQSSVFSSWRDFREYLFNDTYFYPHITSDWKGRIYPSGFIQDIFIFDSFENFHFRHQIECAKKHLMNYENEKFVLPNYEVKIVEDVEKFISEHTEKKGAFDTETNNLNMFVDDFKVGCVQISFDGITGYVLPMKKIETCKRKFSLWLDKIYQIWANGKYDAKCLKRVGVTTAHVDEDIPLVYHLLNTERESNSIKVLSWFIGFGGYEDTLDQYKSKYKITDYLKIPESILYPYAGIDAIVTYLLERNLIDNLVPRQKDTYDLYRKVVIPVIPVFQSIEEEGVLVDKDYINSYHESLMKRMKIIEKDIYVLLNKEINIASNDELGRALEEAGLPDYGRTKKGIYRTGADILIQWERDGFEVVKKILEYRKISKMDSTYIGIDKKEASSFFENSCDDEKSGMYQYVMSDSRVHGTIMPALTDSWRSLCVTGDTKVFLDDGTEICIKDLVANIDKKDYIVKTHLGNNKKVIKGWKKDIVDVLLLKLEDGKTIKLTKGHKVYTDKGWKKVEDLDLENDLILIR